MSIFSCITNILSVRNGYQKIKDKSHLESKDNADLKMKDIIYVIHHPQEFSRDFYLRVMDYRGEILRKTNDVHVHYMLEINPDTENHLVSNSINYE